MSTPVFFVTGASSGFGKAVALDALGRGYHVVASARDASKLSELKAAGAAVVDLDVSAGDAVVAAALQTAVDLYGALTHVVNAAGYVLEGAVEEITQDEVAAIFATNVLGTTATARAAAPLLRASSQAGRQTALASFGSLASYTAAPSGAHYSATKAAVSRLMEAIAQELAPWDIDVTTIEPGYFRTELLNTGAGSGVSRLITPKTRLAVYDGTPAAAARRDMAAVNNKQIGDVVKGARVIVDVLTRTGVAHGRKAPVNLVLGADCVDRARKTWAEREASLKEWEDVSRSTDHAE
ncbi:oxidoreductase, short chain dehydrogenase [Sporothrix brasiliensis 5110]|uniref:Oxidoreductase, short chain dehydrogenase n=1 Tax=Sporothrix brasiliensis 5110 TaxID=1398154 RepID=A0A0C2FN09_9PEZI|nr:oxidoreductase, short chain dehydrogenase [Sporothrix brasiliensis 5110]KIH92433.1 oxidoreductase, short chain dehydrogenase [Sporothrix brasiliensis 5110]